MSVNVTVTGIPETVAMLDHVETAVADLEPVIAAIHRRFMAIESARFAAEGPGWAPLAPATVAEKRRKGLSERILEATGRMRESFVSPDAEGHVFAVTVTPDLTTVEMGSDYRSDTQSGRWAGTALAAFHQEGTDRMPARPVITDIDARAIEWAALLSTWITGAVSAGSL
jgi:hypothetical protein